MFDPSRDQARQFFLDAWRKYRNRDVLTQLETLAADLVAHHPEYHPLLEDADAVHKDFSPEDGQINPFLRCREPAVRAAARAQGALDDSEAAVLGALRDWKNRFK